MVLKKKQPSSGAALEILVDAEQVASPSKAAGAAVAASTPLWKCQLAVGLTQASFVIGSVYLKSSLRYVDEGHGEVFHPIVYAFGREVTAGPILFVLSLIYAGTTWPARHDLWRIALMGACMYLSQLFYIIGIELSGVVVATCIQPAIPVFTAMLGISLQMESAHPQKLLGIGLAVAGAICMVMGGVANSSGATHAAAAARSRMLLGNLCLVVNTAAMAAYYVVSKQAVAKYAAISVAAWAYLAAASLMGVTAALFTDAADWHFPAAMVWPMVYWILVCSVCGYLVVAWAMKFLPASQVAAFQCLQPFIGTLLAFTVLHEQPSMWDLGAFPIVAGLVLVSTDKKDIDSGWQAQAVMARLKRMISSKHLAALSKSTASLGILPQLRPGGGTRERERGT